jgi:hypothetical protein
MSVSALLMLIYRPSGVCPQACFVPQMRAAYLSVVDKYEKKKAAQQALAAVALEEGAAAGVAIAPEVLPAKQRLAATPTDKDHGPYQPSWSSQPITVVCCTSAEI